jgi:twitching motility protein PilT
MRKFVERLLPTESLQKLASEKTIDFSRKFACGTRVRFNIFFQRGNLVIVGRLLAPRIPTIEELGVPPALKELIGCRQGLILITGPTGSGKSTTLASIIQHLNKTRQYHIISIEDPVEYEHENINSVVEQIEIGQDAHSFSSALKGTLRRAPDVIVVGEMRDLESIQNALLLAETGHLVLGTLHTHDAVNAVSRIADVFPEEMIGQIYYILSQVLLGVFAQRLVPKRDGSGMVLACEVLLATAAVRNLVRERKEEQIYSIMQSSGADGMLTLNESLAGLVTSGIVGMEEAMSQSTRPTSLQKRLQREITNRRY